MTEMLDRAEIDARSKSAPGDDLLEAERTSAVARRPPIFADRPPPLIGQKSRSPAARPVVLTGLGAAAGLDVFLAPPASRCRAAAGARAESCFR
jgi:hypothetical protein